MTNKKETAIATLMATLPVDVAANMVKATSEIVCTFTETEGHQLNIRLDQRKINVVGYKADLHSEAYDTLRHLHNTGSPAMIQKLYDILASDKLFRSAGYGKWILEFAPVLFDAKKKTFSVNTAALKNPNYGKGLYKDDSVKAAPLMAAAYGKKFWEMDGGKEDINKSTIDRVLEKEESFIGILTKELKKGTSPEVQKAYMEMLPLLKQLTIICTPLSTEALLTETEALLTETKAAA
jgi:hypothetical protein